MRGCERATGGEALTPAPALALALALTPALTPTLTLTLPCAPPVPHEVDLEGFLARMVAGKDRQQCGEHGGHLVGDVGVCEVAEEEVATIFLVVHFPYRYRVAVYMTTVATSSQSPGSTTTSPS